MSGTFRFEYSLQTEDNFYPPHFIPLLKLKVIDTFRFFLPSLVQLWESFENWLLVNKVAGFRVAEGARRGYGSKFCGTLKNWSNCFIQKVFPFFRVLVTTNQHLE